MINLLKYISESFFPRPKSVSIEKERQFVRKLVVRQTSSDSFNVDLDSRLALQRGAYITETEHERRRKDVCAYSF